MKKRDVIPRFGLAVLVAFAAFFPLHAEEDSPRSGFLSTVADDGNAIFTTPLRKENRLLTLGTIGVIGTTMFLFDDPIQNHLYRDRKKETPDEFRSAGDMLEFAGLAYGTAIGLRGLVWDNPDDRAEGILAYKTYLWSAAALGTLKWVSGRQRPEQTGDPFRWFPQEHASSFPSGHTTQAFAAATLISEHYEKPWVTGLAYGAATSVGVSRALANKHWASDVLAGAALGTAIAHILRKRHEERTQERAWGVNPDTEGIKITYSF